MQKKELSEIAFWILQIGQETTELWFFENMDPLKFFWRFSTELSTNLVFAPVLSTRVWRFNTLIKEEG